MAKPEWGVKRICPACGFKYYDFNKSPITCPSCKVKFDPDVYLKSRKGKNFSPKVAIENNDDINNVDEIEVENDEEVVNDDDPILEINKDDKKTVFSDKKEFDKTGNLIKKTVYENSKVMYTEEYEFEYY